MHLQSKSLCRRAHIYRLSAQFQLLSPSILPMRGGGRSQDLLPNSSWELSLLKVKQCYNNIDSQTKNTKFMHTFMHPLICNNSLHFKTRSVKIKYMCMYVRLTTNTTIQISLFFSTISDTAQLKNFTCITESA